MSEQVVEFTLGYFDPKPIREAQAKTSAALAAVEAECLARGKVRFGLLREYGWRLGLCADPYPAGPWYELGSGMKVRAERGRWPMIEKER